MADDAFIFVAGMVISLPILSSVGLLIFFGSREEE